MNNGLDPELLRLLAEILGDDEATLTRISRMRPSLLFDEPLSAGTPFLTKPERHLLRWRREEVAQLLYEGCMVRLLSNPEQTRTISPGPVTDPNLWVRRCQRALESDAPDWPEERAELSTASPAGLGTQAARLALALQPTDDTRFVLGASFQADQAYEEAKEVAWSHVRSTHMSGYRSAALTVLGACAWNESESNLAMDLYRFAAEERNPSAAAPTFLFLHALARGDRVLLSSATEALDRHREICLPAFACCARVGIRGGLLASLDELKTKLNEAPKVLGVLKEEIEHVFA